MIPAYGSIYNLGHKALQRLLDGPVVVEEKVDGSQFSFMKALDGELFCCTKRTRLLNDAPDKMFAKAVETVKGVEHLLTPGVVYRGEYLRAPKHNALTYDRIPNGHIILFDVDSGQQNYWTYANKQQVAANLGLETVPLLFEGEIKSLESFNELLETVSILGGQRIEGVVVKNYNRFGPDGKVLMGKFVSSAFREIHAREWKAENPSRADVVAFLIEKLKTPARWNKAVQHLREAGRLTDSPKDIGPLLAEVQVDIFNEQSDMIKEALFNWAKKQIMRGVTAGLPEWYKQQLLENQFRQDG